MAGKLPQKVEPPSKTMMSSTRGPTSAHADDGERESPDSAKTSRAPLRVLARAAAREVESRIILDALELHRWNRRRTAEALQISYRSLMYKMKYCKLREDHPSRRAESR